MANFPDLPAEFVEHVKRKGKQMDLEDLVNEYKEWEKNNHG